MVKSQARIVKKQEEERERERELGKDKMEIVMRAAELLLQLYPLIP